MALLGADGARLDVVGPTNYKRALTVPAKVRAVSIRPRRSTWSIDVAQLLVRACLRRGSGRASVPWLPHSRHNGQHCSSRGRTGVVNFDARVGGPGDERARPTHLPPLRASKAKPYTKAALDASLHSKPGDPRRVHGAVTALDDVVAVAHPATRAEHQLPRQAPCRKLA